MLLKRLQCVIFNIFQSIRHSYMLEHRGRLCEVIAWSASSQVVHASGTSWTAFLEAENFSTRIRRLLRCSNASSSTRATTWRLVFMCQRSISPLQRILYRPRRPPVARPGSESCRPSTLSHQWLTKSSSFSQHIDLALQCLSLQRSTVTSCCYFGRKNDGSEW